MAPSISRSCAVSRRMRATSLFSIERIIKGKRREAQRGTGGARRQERGAGSCHTEPPALPGFNVEDYPALETFAACGDRKSTRLNSSHGYISYAVFCLKKKKKKKSLSRILIENTVERLM